MNNQEINYYVYFDGKQLGSHTATACSIHTDVKSLKPVASKTSTVDGTGDNQFTVVLKALLTAVECIKENEISGNIAILHQNNTVMNWLLTGRCNDNYAGLFAEVLEEMSTLQFDCKVFLKPIPPQENKAKKAVAKIKPPKNDSYSMTRLVLNNPYKNPTDKDESNIIQFRNAMNG